MKSSELLNNNQSDAIAVFADQTAHDGWHMVQYKNNRQNFSVRKEKEAGDVQISLCDILGISKSSKQYFESYFSNPLAIAERMLAGITDPATRNAIMQEAQKMIEEENEQKKESSYKSQHKSKD
ncbi:hypothetical protein [Zymomonas mobilis]|uniref:Uncharacterized protein n=1 Tax=Zymomonas mobilis subsp. pomaceae (strain ATCC 29192 / DSM 22645 / JCM 10191 / CCUG 17912 / NBRC 13757 / NCIMB 11200 / NRRL B-4491 / Barker I) TaxID=579138 RepID=F8ETW0_ZYMMT|nr:hypothetical protein [Zymomonas mobilis]AEI38057.1 hypothetical protein Zymop_1162 [Zymomonas mobilis subsp. pomaceae ATCC 29192]MDX5949423.1 hypothetical protein [Zymomonas mobilis subsp. pomaceae]GEB89166.1 hypothetical protein ZMO02_08030 [Zymomonas mobilis subsp. pomaceae]